VKETGEEDIGDLIVNIIACGANDSKLMDQVEHILNMMPPQME